MDTGTEVRDYIQAPERPYIIADAGKNNVKRSMTSHGIKTCIPAYGSVTPMMVYRRFTVKTMVYSGTSLTKVGERCSFFAR
jgi:hypothetical protein